MRAAAVVLATSPLPGACLPELEPRLGPERCARLQAELVARAARWAASVGSPAWLAVKPGGDAAAVRALAPDGVEVVEQAGDGVGAGVAAAVRLALDAGADCALVAASDVPSLDAGHAAGAVGDLVAGCDVSLGPALGGGLYLLAIRRIVPELFDLPAELWASPDMMPLALAAARDAGLEIGLLRPERALRTEADARAACVDPLYPPELVALLRGG